MPASDSQAPTRKPPSSELVTHLATSNDGTLNAIVNKSVRSLDLPLRNPMSHEDEMLSWLHYPVDDPSDRGYCSDIFGDLPHSRALVVRHSVNQFGGRPPQHGLLHPGASIFSGMLYHQNLGVSRSTHMPTAGSENTQEAVESCGSRPEASCQVAGADAVAAIGARHQAADFTTSHVGMEVASKLESDGEVLSEMGNMVQPTCKSSSANATFCMQSERSQTLSQDSSQQQPSFTGHVPQTKPLDFVNCHTPSAPMERQAATNFVLFSCRAVETKTNLHMVGESSGPTNIERVRQTTGQHGMPQEPAALYPMQTNLGAAQVRWLPSPITLPPPALCSSSVELEKSITSHGQQSPPLPPPPSSVCETRAGTNLSRDTIANLRMSVTSSEKGLGPPDPRATSPSRCSASSTERSGKITDSSFRRGKQGVGDDSDYQSEYAEERAMDKKPPSNAKRMRTAEMHNQSERKRRVKINDKLKTLQELIPNGSKPDKASLLDAVIDYVKLLQSQLQVMSMRTGISIPSWIIPNTNMQHLQMPALPQMRLSADMGMGVGLGMGMRMGMGMGMMDVNSAAVGTGGCTIMQMPFPGQPPAVGSSHSAALQPADHLHAPGMVNAHNFYAASSQVQRPPVNLNMSHNVPIYNAYIPQQQLQLHPRSQQQQQQFQVQLQQLHRPPGSTGKRTSC